MKKFKVSIIYLIVLCSIIFISSCSQKSNESKPKPDNEVKAIISMIEGLETGLIGVMRQTDLVPYFEKQISEKKLQEAEKKQMEILTAQSTEKQGTSGGESESKGSEEFKPKPITINDTLLAEIMKQEAPEEEKEKKEEKLPEDIVFIWQEINTMINSLHNSWNDVEPKLIEKAVSSTALSEFDDTLNSLTISGSKSEHMETLVNANTLTYHIAQFVHELQDATMGSVYYIKYHVRQIVLDQFADNDQKVNENMNALMGYQESLTYKLAEEKQKELADKLKASILDLEKAISLKDLNVIKIKGSIVIKNVNAIKEKLAKK